MQSPSFVLTICFAFLTGVAVIEDALCIVSPGQAAKLYPLQYIRKLGEIVSLHEMNRYPV